MSLVQQRNIPYHLKRQLVNIFAFNIPDINSLRTKFPFIIAVPRLIDIMSFKDQYAKPPVFRTLSGHHCKVL